MPQGGLALQDDAKQGLVDFLEENNIDLVITGSATTSRFRKTLNVRRALSFHCAHQTTRNCHVLPGLAYVSIRKDCQMRCMYMPCLGQPLVRCAEGGFC